jgi:excisionase family DNA binding protein
VEQVDGKGIDAAQLMTVGEAAEQMGVSARFVRRLVSERRISHHRLGRCLRLRRADVETYAAASRAEPRTVSATAGRDVG